MNIILAKKILPISSAPLTNGGVVVSDGKILDIGSAARLMKRYPNAKPVDLGGLLVMPGLVNTHAHLELSNLHDHMGEHADLIGWIKELIRLRREVGSRGRAAAVRKAIRQAVSTGTTCIGDISSTEEAIPAIVRSGLRSVVFLEVIGLDNSAADGTINRLRQRLSAIGRLPDRVGLGISPHSPYSVSASLYNKIRVISSELGLHLAIHVAETYDEYAHVKGGVSRLTEYMAFTGWDAHPQNRSESPLGFIKDMGLLNGLLAVHAVHVSKKDMRALAGSGASVAHCPRSNHMLNTGTAPVADMIERGINVGIGTDSLASNIDMDLWEEMRFAYLVNRLTAEQVIGMATLGGAKALRLENVTGTLEPGKDADLIAIKTPATRAASPYRPLLYNTRAGDVKLTMVQGRPIHISEDMKGVNGL